MDILEKCPRSEHIKHAGFGALVLVPATLGLYSMTYAISTFVQSPYLYISAGIVWALIVFIFDRFIVSSFRKKDSIARDIRSVTFISRIVFSTFVGIAVAHPLVLLYFHKSIEVNMDERAHSQMDSIEQVYTAQIKNYQLDIDTLSRNLVGISDTIHNQENILHDEIIGVVRGDQKTSGIPGQGPTFKYDTAYLHRLYSQLEATKAMNIRKRADDSLNMKRLDSIRSAKINRLTFSRDYLERESALRRLSASNPIIRFTTWFLILFFILVDILPVTWKGLTNRGPYDEYLGEVELRIRNEVKNEILDSETRVELHSRRKKKELDTEPISFQTNR